MSKSVGKFLAAFADWAKAQEQISELLLVGSHATGRSTPNSDIDLIVLCKNPNNYLEEPNWIEQFGIVKKTAIEDWGKVKSLRVWYQNGRKSSLGSPL